LKVLFLFFGTVCGKGAWTQRKRKGHTIRTTKKRKEGRGLARGGGEKKPSVKDENKRNKNEMKEINTHKKFSGAGEDEEEAFKRKLKRSGSKKKIGGDRKREEGWKNRLNVNDQSGPSFLPNTHQFTKTKGGGRKRRSHDDLRGTEIDWGGGGTRKTNDLPGTYG